ncbi:MAG: VWA domain-containing protein [bacterium]
MKFPVAHLLRVSVSQLIVTALLASAMTGQTARRVAGKRATAKSGRGTTKAARNDSLIMCQGLPIPAGYAIIAYLTSTACPHGAYVLKKQDPYSESVAKTYANRNASTTATTAATEPGVRGAKPSAQQPVSVVGGTQQPARDSDLETQTLDQSVPSKRQATGSTPQLATNSTQPAKPGSRPRRVATSAARDEVAVITEDPPERPARAPQWAGTAPTGSAVASSASDIADPGPEEVGEGDVVRVSTNLVTVPVSVLDRQGRFIADLTREDFSVFENGVEQKIAYWEPADKPFTVALLLDTSPSTQFHLWEIKEAAIAFARQLRPQDRVLIVSFNDQVLLLTEVTNDLNVISAVIEQNANMGNATRVYDAVHLVIKERLNKIKGRKAIVLFTDGVDTASYQANYASTMREVEELDALIYPIQYDTTDYMRAMQGAGGNVTVVTTTSNGPFGSTTSRVTYGAPKVTGPGGQPLPGTTKADYDRANEYLSQLSEKTGGRLYRANDTTQLADAFSRIAEELRRQYSLGYYPQDGNAGNANRRQIKVRVNRPNVAVKARDSYTRTTPPAGTQ